MEMARAHHGTLPFMSCQPRGEDYSSDKSLVNFASSLENTKSRIDPRHAND